jgi:hypothetical protein
LIADSPSFPVISSRHCERPPTLTMFRSPFSAVTLAFLLTGCATVPLPGKGFNPSPSVRPIKPLMEGRAEAKLPAQPDPKNRVTATLSTPSPPVSTKPGQPLSDSTIAAKLQEAEDKAASAASLSQSAQTPDDWKLVVQQWQRSIELLPTPPTKSKLFDKVQDIRGRYNANLKTAQSQSQSASPGTSGGTIQIDRATSGGRGFIYGAEASPEPTPSDKPKAKPSDKSEDKPGDKPGDKSNPKTNNSGTSTPTPAPSPKN